MLNQKSQIYEEKQAKYLNAAVVLTANILLMIISITVFIFAIISIEKNSAGDTNIVFEVILIIISSLYFSIIGWIIFGGLKVLRPNEALVLTLFGKYYGTLKGAGFYFVNPFTTALNPAAGSSIAQTGAVSIKTSELSSQHNGNVQVNLTNKKISLKAMTLNNDKQKINDQLGNPIIIGIIVIWKVQNTAKAVFNVENYKDFLSIQCDSALRNIVRMYPYDSTADNEKTLRGSSDEISQKLAEEIQKKVDIAGLEVVEARITHLAYAPEIAAAMLQRQQATAIVDARQMIVDGAVGMVEMALNRLNESNVVELDEERKAAMVSNLLVVLCGNKDAQPVVNSGSLY